MADYISQFTGSEIDQRLAKVPQLETAVAGKQATLVSGTNIKTINGQPVLGSGDMQIQSGDTNAVKYVAQTLTDEQKAQARANIDAASLEDIADMDFVTAATLPTASASTMGHIYLIGPDANNNYDRYFTQEDGSSYSWVSLGSTQIDLSTYATKEEVTQLEAKVDELETGKMPLVFDKQDKYIKTDGTVLATTDNDFECTTDYYPVKEGDVLILSLYAYGNVCHALYDTNKTFVSYFNSECWTNQTTEITIPSNGYMRFSNRKARNTNPYVIVKGTGLNDLKGKIEDLENETSQLSSEIISVGDDVSKVEHEVDKIKDNELHLDFDHAGFINANNDGTITNDSDFECTTAYYPVKNGDVLVISLYAYGNVCHALYDENKAFVSAFNSECWTGGTAEITVPSDGFMRFSNRKARNTKPYAEFKGDSIAELRTDVSNLDGRVSAIEAKDSTAEIAKKLFTPDKDAWIIDETVKTFYPKQKRIEHKYNGEVSPQRRFVALGFDDFVPSDFAWVIPLLEKYGFRSTFNRVQREIDISETPSDIIAENIEMNAVLNGGHELGDHTWIHQMFPYNEPLFNGQNPSSPDGSQVAFPSNSQLRDDRGDGKNVFGRTLTNNVKTDIGYQAPDINTTWGAMTDAQCQQLREAFSLYGGAYNLITLMDTLSNKYLGTTGSSRGSWDNVSGKYTGGIFTGCKTSANHEVWERIVQITALLMKDRFGLNYNIQTWSLPGSRRSMCYFENDGKFYYDAGFTQYCNDLARFESSLYEDLAGNAKSRSWTDVLREYGYRVTHDAADPGRYDGTHEGSMRVQNILNADLSRPDCLIYHTQRSFNFSNAWSEYTEGTDLQGTEPYEVQMYDGGYGESTKKSFRTAIEVWRRNMANGVVWGEVIDSDESYSLKMIVEGLLKYAYKTGAEVITKAEAYDICFNHPVRNGNLIYNPGLRNTAKEFMPTAITVPTNPDGYVGDCSVSVSDGVPVLSTTGDTIYRHYGIPYGKIKFSADIKGTGTVAIRFIKNNTRLDHQEWATAILTINVSNADFERKDGSFIVPDNAMTAYETQYAGYGDKIIGLHITYSSGLFVKNIDLRMD